MIRKTYEGLVEFAEYAGNHAQDKYLSLYLLTDPSHPENQSEIPAWKIFLKNAVADIEADLDPVQTKQWKKVRLTDTSPETAWARTRKRLEKYLTGYSPEGKTLALFISPNGEYKFELPVRLPNTYQYGFPHIQELLWALDEYEQHAVLLFAEDQTRVLQVALGGTGADTAITSDQAWMRQQRKSGHAQNIADRKDELSRRFVGSVAGEIDKYFLKTPDIERVILGGNMEIANAVLGSLHRAVQEKVIAVLPIPITLASHEVAERIRETAKQAEREHEAALVSEVVAQANAGGRGAVGYTAVGRALDRAAVRLLALPYPGDSETVEPLLLQAVRQGSHIEFLHGEPAEAADRAGGIVAQLYYAIN